MRSVPIHLMVVAVSIEVCWLYAAGGVVGFLRNGQGPVLAFSLTAVVLATAFLTAYILERLDLPLPALRLVGALIGVLTVLNAASFQIRGEPSLLDPFWLLSSGEEMAGNMRDGFSRGLPVVMAVLLWWRGARLAHGLTSFYDPLSTFRWGIIVIAFAILEEGLLNPVEGVAWVALPFFGLGLWGLILARELQSGVALQAISLRTPAVAVLGIMGLGLLLGLLPYGQLGGPFAIFGGIIDQILKVILFILYIPVGLFMELLALILKSAGIYLDLRLFRGPPESPLEELKKTVEEKESLFPPFVGAALKFLLLAAILAILVTLLARAFSRRRLHTVEQGDEIRESLWSGGSVLDDLGNLIKQLFSPVTRAFTPLSIPGEGGRAFILRVYYALLTLSASRGLSRRPWETPFEFLDRLALLFPLLQHETHRITEAFSKTRYGAGNPRDEDVREVQADWALVRQAAQEPPP